LQLNAYDQVSPPGAVAALKLPSGGGWAGLVDHLVAADVGGAEGLQRGGDRQRKQRAEGSAMGAHYRHTTPEMAVRVIDAIQQRLTTVIRVAEQALESHPNLSLKVL
jgi:hypothetical protein